MHEELKKPQFSPKQQWILCNSMTTNLQLLSIIVDINFTRFWHVVSLVPWKTSMFHFCDFLLKIA